MKSTIRGFGIGIIIVCATAAMLAVGCEPKDGGSNKQPGDSRIKIYQTPAWSMGGHLVCRYEAEDSGVLLIRHRTYSEMEFEFGGSGEQPPPRQDVVYRLDPDDNAELGQVGAEAWEQGAVLDTWDLSQQLRVPSKFSLHHRKRILRYQVSEVESAGNNVLYWAKAPQKNAILVLSTVVPERMGLFSSPVDRGKPGTRYHQMVAYKMGEHPKNLGEAIKLPLSKDAGEVYGFVSPDSKYAMYTDPGHTFLMVITHDDDQVPRGRGE